MTTENPTPAGEAPDSAPVLRFPACTSEEDIAVIVALLAAAGTGAATGPAGTPRLWGAPGRAVRPPMTPSRSGWWLSQLP